MKNLKNMTILIGRDPEKPRLIAGVEVGGKLKLVAIDSNSVAPNSISRFKPQEKTAHCKIDIDGNGEMTITNLKDVNVTYVDNVPVISRRITPEHRVALGKDAYPIDINAILKTVKAAIGVDITPLKKVWEEYETEIKAIEDRRAVIAKRRMLPMLLSMGSGALVPILGICVGNASLYITIPVTLISFGILFNVYRQKDTSREDKKKAEEKLRSKYVCPACGKYLKHPYADLLDNEKCPKSGCGARFLHD